MSRNLSSKRTRLDALGYLRAGNVRVLRAVTPEGSLRPSFVEFIVHGHQSDYRIKLTGGEWTSTCHCERDQKECPHIAAVQLVTGYESAASK